jgi:signal transduction histidine kinase
MKRLVGKGLLLAALSLMFEVAFALVVVAMDRGERRDQAAEARGEQIVVCSYRLMALLVDMETAIRGYIITEQPRFTEPYDNALNQVPAELRQLRALGAEVDTLDRLAATLLQYQTAQRDRVAQGKRAEAAALVAGGTGKRMMDGFRAAMRDFLARQQRLDAERTRAHVTLRQRLRNVIVGGVAVNAFVAVGMMIAFITRITKRLGVVMDNTRRLERQEPLLRRQRGGDEIAQLDARFHEMAEALQKSRRELEASNGELEAFSYSVSHDLRAPLRAVSGYAKMVEEDCAERLDDNGRRYLGVIRSEARRMGQLIDDLLAFSRLGRNPLHLAPVDVGALVHEALGDIAPASVELESPPPALADRAMLRQVLVNLLSNAVKFSPEGRRNHVVVGGAPDGEQNVYWVRDDGVGFDMRFADKLFKVFQRLHAQKEFDGTGVGLAIVQRVITRHGGRVWAESEVGRGACFYFTLPRPEEKAA